MLLLVLHKPIWTLASPYPLAPSPQGPPFSPFPNSMSASSPGSLPLFLCLFYFLGLPHFFWGLTCSDTKCRYFSWCNFIFVCCCVWFITYVSVPFDVPATICVTSDGVGIQQFRISNFENHDKHLMLITYVVAHFYSFLGLVFFIVWIWILHCPFA